MVADISSCGTPTIITVELEKLGATTSRFEFGTTIPTTIRYRQYLETHRVLPGTVLQAALERQ